MQLKRKLNRLQKMLMHTISLFPLRKDTKPKLEKRELSCQEDRSKELQLPGKEDGQQLFLFAIVLTPHTRALITQPKVLLLDEATSALDSESEGIVQAALDKIMHDRTTIVIAHRLSTIRNADQIAVLDQGKIAELGTHSELMEKDGIYASMVLLQHETEAPLDSEMTTQASAEDVTEIKEVAKEAKEVEKEETKVSMKRVLMMNKPEFKYMTIGCLASIILGVINPIFAIIFSEMVALYYQPEDEIRDEARWWSLSFVGVGLAFLFFGTVQSGMFAIAAENLTMRLRARSFKVQLSVQKFV